MSKVLLRLFTTALALVLAAHIIPGISFTNWVSVLACAIVLGVLTVILRPILLILTLPITILTLGLFSFVINATLFWIAGSFVPGFTVDGFFAAFLGSVLVSLVQLITQKILT